jgi:hypothetical protein
MIAGKVTSYYMSHTNHITAKTLTNTRNPKLNKKTKTDKKIIKKFLHHKYHSYQAQYHTLFHKPQ